MAKKFSNLSERKGDSFMVSVRINSGEITWTSDLKFVPKEEWATLVRLRKYGIATHLNHDCHCLVQFVNEAETMYQELGYASVEDMIRRGYELDPEEVGLAVEWLRRKKPDWLVGFPEAIEMGKRHRAAVDKAREVQSPVMPNGVNRRYSGVKEKEKPTPLPKGDSSERKIARLRRDHPDIAARLEKGEFPSVAAAVRAANGQPAIKQRKKATPLDQLRAAWSKASDEERKAFMEISGLIYP
jgi:Arc/MetJ-type ribon-helix-helix transcriptional regulator